MQTKKESKHYKEYARKTIHLIFGIAFLIMIQILGTTQSAYILFALLIIGLIASFLIMKKIELPILSTIVKIVERENEKKLPGKAAIMFFASAIIRLIIFQNNKNLVLTSLSVQIFADAFAAIIGINFGKHKIFREKTLEGSTTFFIIALICINYFYPLHIAIITALIATIVEILPLDDNLFVPLFTAGLLKILI
ncbi:MAG: Cytidylyltransferase family protein [archaeon ADurb.Bin336]|nr:MAG: Cytidylyltransferase family protein [archaeon ADurb.Bin336]